MRSISLKPIVYHNGEPTACRSVDKVDSVMVIFLFLIRY